MFKHSPWHHLQSYIPHFMGEFLQQLAQRLQINQLITKHLTDIKELIIVPHIFLHQIPFAALPITTETVTIADNLPMDNTKGMKFNPRPTQTQTTTISKTYLSDKFRLRVVSSCQILSYCDNCNKTTNSPKMGIVENATGDLEGSEYECQNLAQMFQVPNNLHLKYQQATVNNYRQLAKQVQILHSSHHASADLINLLDSKLHLFDGDVTLGDVFTWRLPKLTDVFLSCCETNLTFSNKLNDDILSIAAGFLSAGALSVVSTLWSVEDKSTAEFCQLYYQFRNQGETRPEALRKAQFELRKRENFKHPYHWAGFVSQGLE
ncbi:MULTISPECIES: CHAT domain-containing protein [Okeania]|uniref:CHAT domain-containing protein n=1 Tax=Okeania hirsuta TaxID=1458930 RepID=A0A3N6QUS1_9CYAN|nr:MULTISPECIES: CHAT domain-containing protein [Okeania]NES79182.1 CHAT domain-containing protein [Okeania sp. SIO1H4]NES92238.1 CHAT domain-containing protein [Okeania sp. SIO2B9]NET22778.1 CHAT domain-containing protein [Okeania sp. SIO1H5]NET79831.1 CHAT domain-containing protein [Okeania sp. SIO1F9]NET96161.1 CHAT domain-containing protein [Okeania sp. SIO1H2]